MNWNEERTEELKKLWGLGLSASLIAIRLGGVTRSSVISKVHRLGLSGRKPGRKGEMRGARTLPPQLPKRRAAERKKTQAEQAIEALFSVRTTGAPAAAAEELVIPLEERRTIETLDATSCRWPIGDPHSKSFHFCGRKRVEGLPYCEFHGRKAFQPRMRDVLPSSGTGKK